MSVGYTQDIKFITILSFQHLSYIIHFISFLYKDYIIPTIKEREKLGRHKIHFNLNYLDLVV